MHASALSALTARHRMMDIGAPGEHIRGKARASVIQGDGAA